MAFTRSTGNMPWFDPRLQVDGPSYVQSLADYVRGGDFWELSDLYHSPGYQLYLRAVLKAGGNSGVPRRVKFLAWGLAALCVGLTFVLGERVFGKRVGGLAAVMLAFSLKWTAYINLFQYEIPLAFLLTSLAALLSAVLPRAKRFEAARVLLAGLLAAGICFIHFRWLAILPLAALGLSKKDLKALGLLLLTPAALIGGWSLYQSRRLEILCVVQDLAPWGEQFRLHNHPRALGYPLPLIEPVEPSGAGFILSRPGRYLWLLKERYLYMWDIKKDLWYVGPQAGRGERVFHLAAFLLFGSGLALKFLEDRRDRLLGRHAMIYVIPGVTLAGPLLSPGSSRYLVPVLPLVFLFQAHALVWLFSGWRPWPTAGSRGGGTSPGLPGR